MSHKLVSLYIGEGEYYTRTDADNALAEKDEEIAKLKADYSAKVEELCIEKTNVDTLEQAWKQSQRALWIARAELCRRLDVDRYLRNHRNSWYNENCLTWAEACVAMEVKMCKAETKCRAKVED